MMFLAGKYMNDVAAGNFIGIYKTRRIPATNRLFKTMLWQTRIPCCWALQKYSVNADRNTLEISKEYLNGSMLQMRVPNCTLIGNYQLVIVFMKLKYDDTGRVIENFKKVQISRMENRHGAIRLFSFE